MAQKLTSQSSIDEAPDLYAKPPPGLSRSEWMQWVRQQNLRYIAQERPYYQRVANGWIDPDRLRQGEHWLISASDARARLAELDDMEHNPTCYPEETVDLFYTIYLERTAPATDLAQSAHSQENKP